MFIERASPVRHSSRLRVRALAGALRLVRCACGSRAVPRRAGAAAPARDADLGAVAQAVGAIGHDRVADREPASDGGVLAVARARA